MKRKKFSALFMAVLFVGTLALSACSQNSPPSQADADSAAMRTSDDGQATDLLAQILDRGEIIIATEGTWSPWTYHDENDDLVGYDVEVARKVAEKLGVEAKFVESEWDGIFAGLDAKRYDIAANGIEITEERAEKYDFSTPYAYIRTALIVRGDRDDIQTFDNLNGKQTANSLGSTYAALAESYGATSTAVDSLGETLELVLAGRVDATLNADVSYYDYLNVHPDTNLKIVALTDEAAHVSIPVRKDEESASLLAAINEAIAALEESGELSALSEKYFGTDVSQISYGEE